MADKPRQCKDCKPPKSGGKWRPAPFPGPRCATHDREVKKARRLRNREESRKSRFGITAEEFQRIKAYQGGGCICAQWTGYNGSGKRELSTDHDHQTQVIRGALCKHCNDLLGRVRDDPDYFRRMIEYLLDPPAVQVLGKRLAPVTRSGKNHRRGLNVGNGVIDETQEQMPPR